jgi:hypothetical protein
MAVLFFVELILGVLMVTLLIWLTYGRPALLEPETLLVKARVLETLELLDRTGSLRYRAVRNDSLAIEAEMKRFLGGLNFMVSLCFQPCDIELPYERVVTTSYLLAGDYGRFMPVEIVVNSW